MFSVVHTDISCSTGDVTKHRTARTALRVGVHSG